MAQFVPSIAAALIVVVLLAVSLCDASSPQTSIPTLQSTCVQYYANLYVQTGVRLMFVPLPELIECFRTTPMNVSHAYDIAKYAQYAYELHSVRLYARSNVKSAFVNLLGVLFDPSSTSGSPQFASAYNGISEFDFHVIVTNAFSAMQDCHFNYLHKNLFGSSFVSRPAVVASRRNATTGKQELYFASRSAGLDYWFQWFRSQGSVLPIPTAVDAAFSLDSMAAAIDTAVQSGAAIASINGLDPISSYVLEMWRSSSCCSDDNSVFNDLLNMNLNVNLGLLPAQYGTIDTQLRWQHLTASAGVMTYGPHLSIRNDSLSPLPLTFVYYDEIVLSNGQSFRIPLLVDFRDSSSVDTTCSRNTSLLTPPSGAIRRNEVIAMRLEETRGEMLYAHNPWSGFERKNNRSAPPSASGLRRRRIDQYVSHSDASLQGYLVYGDAKGVLNAYFIPSNSLRESMMYLRVFTFFGGSASNFATAVQLGMQALVAAAKPSKSRRLVVDVRGNGGGYVFGQDLLLSYIAYDVFQAPPIVNFTSSENIFYVRSQQPTNASTMQYTMPVSTKMNYGRSSMSNMNPNLATSNYQADVGPQLLEELLNATYNATQDLNPLIWYYSSSPAGTWYDNSTAMMGGTDYDAPHFTTPHVFDPMLSTAFDASWSGWTDVTIVTDGTCGSACSMFETRLREHLPKPKYQIRTVGFGGLYPPGGTAANSALRMSASQFTGGSVLSMSCIANYYATQSTSSASYRFPGRYDLYLARDSSYYPIDMRFNVWHWLSNPASQMPRQMISHPVDEQVPMWEVTMQYVTEYLLNAPVPVVSSAGPLLMSFPITAAAGIAILLATVGNW